MIPLQTIQLDYNTVHQLIDRDLSLILESHLKKPFDYVICKLRSGAFVGVHLSYFLNLNMGTLEIPRNSNSSDILLHLPENKKITDNLHLLIVDSICGTGKTLQQIDSFFSSFKNISYETYCPLIDSNSLQKPTILGNFISSKYFQPPWELRSNTPLVTLERFEFDDIKGSKETYNAIGFSSQESFDLISKDLFKTSLDSIFIYSEDQFKNTIIDNSLKRVNMNLTFENYENLLNNKSNFILNNGITHYFETDLTECIILSSKCPVTKFYYCSPSFNSFYRILATKENFIF